MLGFGGRTVSVAAAHLCSSNAEVATDINQWVWPYPDMTSFIDLEI